MRILYVDIDALRPDRLGCYGYPRDTSPNIDALAREGIRFDQCFTPDAPCLPSRTAFYSGRFGIQTGVVGHGHTAATPKNEGLQRGFRDAFDDHGLARQLQLAGYHTAMISPFGQRHAAWWIYAGFNEIHNTGKGGKESAEEIDPVLFPWLERNAVRDNWFLHVNFWDAHTPYRVPMAYGDPFADVALPDHLNDPEVIRRHSRLAGPHSAMEFDMYTDREYPQYPRQPQRIADPASMRRMVDGYDTAIRYVDERIGRIVEELKRAGVYDDTLVLLSADHGENFGELGIYGEHGTADVATCRVPLIVRGPGISTGDVDEGLRYSIDVAPTLMDLVGAEKPSIWDGESFAPSLSGKGCAGREELVLSQCAHVCQRGVRWGRWLYMRTWHDGFHLFPREMLFDIESDPFEQHDVAGSHPAVVHEGAWRLARWHDEQMTRMPQDKQDPLWTVMREGGPFHANLLKDRSPLPDYLARLERTGRLDAAKALRKKYSSWL